MVELAARDDELGRALARLRDEGRVVVVGPGGIGKTVLALALADRLGVERVVVEADVVGRPDAIESHAVDLVGGPRAGDDPGDVLAARIHGRRLVLVLDGADALVDEVLRRAGHLPVGGDGPWVVVTSRVHPETHTWPVIRLEPLDVDGGTSSDAATVFRDRYRAAGGDRGVLDSSPGQLARVLVDTGGVPLAIAVAAARVAVVGFVDHDDIVATGGPDDVVTRSLRRSLDQLPAEAVELFAALGVTSSRFPVSLAVALVDHPPGDTVERLALLARHSLVQPVADGHAMLPPIHRAARRLASSDGGDAVGRHLAWCRVRARPCDTAAEAVGVLEVAADLRLGIDRAVAAGAVDAAFDLTVALEDAYRLGMQHGRRGELLEATLTGLETIVGAERARAELWRRLGLAYADITGLVEAQACLDRAEAALGDVEPDDPLLADVRRIRAACRAEAGDPAGALGTLLEVAAASARGGDVAAELHARRFAANVLLELGRLDEADEQAARVVTGAGESHAGLRQLGLDSQGMIALERGDLATCEAIGRVLAANPAAPDRHLDGEYLMLAADPVAHAQRAVWAQARSDGEDGARSYEILAELGRAIRLLVADDAERALVVATDVAVAAQGWGVVWGMLDALLLAGDAAVALGDRRQAATCFRHALVHASRNGYALRVPDALDGLARVLPGRRGEESAATAAALRRHHGAAPRPRPWQPPLDTRGTSLTRGWIVHGSLSTAAVEHFGRIDDAPATSTHPLDALSPAERRVTALVAQGHTNREIAERLHIGRRTVETHILHAFQKLDVTNRTQLAMAAMTDRT